MFLLHSLSFNWFDLGMLLAHIHTCYSLKHCHCCPYMQIAILQISSAGVGLTLTAANTVIFAELDWVPGKVTQAEDRAHRIGQASCVNVVFLCVKDSIDDTMWEGLQKKLQTTGQVLNGVSDKLQV